MPRAKGNAVAGVKARNGVEKIGSRKETVRNDRTVCPALTSALIAVLDSQGLVVGVLAGRTAARAFLRGGA
ncbi:hypothetical protein ABC766_13005 [Methylobacterium fujisawaense]|uniref:hypothetical protein n=1 Tax=Methylobacterium fujisawaense TaxID=107400 RepID=UPI0031F56F8E